MDVLASLEILANRLKQTKTASEKIAILDKENSVAEFFEKKPALQKAVSSLLPEWEASYKQVIAIGQAPTEDIQNSMDAARGCLEKLAAVDDFYREIGGIVGYQSQVEKLLKCERIDCSLALYHSPRFVDISKNSPQIDAAVERGILSMDEICEMYPLGGAADRLHLVDEMTGQDLPAAKLEFSGRTLLEGMLRDLEAREYAYFKRTKKVIATPVAIMTSHEKNNWFHIQKILEENNWFGRPADSFRLFVQPLVPTVDRHGKWIWAEPWKPLLKPGGHGMMWKIAKDQGILDWLHSLGRKYILVRQVNNPLAGFDHGLLAFAGLGISKQMSFGFASCPRVIQSAEGVNVLIEKKTKSGYSYVISNVEYCDFLKYGIEDKPICENEPYSQFPSNTNILFVKLDALQKAIDICPFPGLLINIKKGPSWHEPIGRLESTMQNIADAFVEEKDAMLKEKCLEKVFITYNVRHKTISTAKKAWVPGASLLETPEHCFYDLMHAYRELLEKECEFVLAKEKSLEETLQTHPSFISLLHPALGPLFSEIRKKIHRGSIADGSELCIDAADVKIQNLSLAGSLLIRAEHPLGIKRFSDEIARCELKRVSVANAGVDWTSSRPYWKYRYQRKGCLEIVLKGNGEFIAEDVVFDQNRRFEVPAGQRMIVTQKNKKLFIRKEAVQAPRNVPGGKTVPPEF